MLPRNAREQHEGVGGQTSRGAAHGFVLCRFMYPGTGTDEQGGLPKKVCSAW